MSVFDQVVNKVASVEPGAASALSNQVLEFLKSPELGGIQGLVQKFEKAGLGATVQSWIGGAKPLPIAPDQITGVLGSDVISKFAAKTGLSATDVAAKLTAILPQTIGQLTPGGKVPSSGAIGDLGSKLAEKLGI